MKAMTWKQVAALRGPGHEEARAAFIERYGDRAKAALMAAGDALGRPVLPGPPTARVCGTWTCEECPLSHHSPWRERVEVNTCGRMAMPIYALMVEEYGRAHEECEKVATVHVRGEVPVEVRVHKVRAMADIKAKLASLQEALGPGYKVTWNKKEGYLQVEHVRGRRSQVRVQKGKKS